jgi:hypothetical protein
MTLPTSKIQKSSDEGYIDAINGNHSALALPRRGIPDQLAIADGTHPLVTHQIQAGVYAAPIAPKSWENNGDFWPGRSEIQEVAKGVCITNFFGAKKLPLLKFYGITHVLVCASELPEAFPYSFQYLKLERFTDNTGTDLSQQLETTIPWLKRALSEGGRVLLHCATGSSRSGAIMIAYLMHTQNLTLEKALKIAQGIRPIIKPNPGFLEKLEKWSA